jgi:uncharacterized protein (TIGR03792 family)
MTSPPITPQLPPAAAPLRSLAALLLVLLLLWGAPPPAAATSPAAGQARAPVKVEVIEHLRVQVPAEARQAWLDAERGSWDPWLRRQAGFVDRQLLWDPERQEGTLLIHWASREQWQAIPPTEVARVQRRFEQLARHHTGQEHGNPFPLTHQGELLPP